MWKTLNSLCKNNSFDENSNFKGMRKKGEEIILIELIKVSVRRKYVKQSLFKMNYIPPINRDTTGH